MMSPKSQDVKMAKVIEDREKSNEKTLRYLQMIGCDPSVSKSPCPFCGGMGIISKAIKQEDFGGEPLYRASVSCWDCLAQTIGSASDPDEAIADAVESWERRFPPAS